MYLFSKFHEIDSSYQEQIGIIWQEFVLPKLLLTFSSPMLLMPQIPSPIRIPKSMNVLEKKKKNLPANHTSALAFSSAWECLLPLSPEGT